ncbi:sodium/proton antiporter, CPA1 family [Aliiroseovarius sediminilitoris]|uniref:Sodium/proton antiporter, CPA1 family n=1 Tax=Aliiroseovarius sediminilitoris TaxID=1173584 RepID=A0A1I0Q5X1_9RHOB|nr:sodium:proton antiporter [Aliiroseovarius sediminilitoris]SEW22196.1 sodium/proton antiporter, CPA1 family [Aliiroseovarius sediminilitoris]
MNILQITSLLIVLAGAFGSINYLFLKLPSPIGILLVSLMASLALMGLDFLIPAMGVADQVRSIVADLDFSDTLLEGMLGLLLFAGALHVKIQDLRAQWGVVFLMATMGVALSTIVVGVGFSWLTGAPLLIALVFGALISPTDPVAVLGVLREANLQKSLETKIAGESLFNDGVGYVVFLVLVGLAFTSGQGEHAPDPSVEAALKLFFQEAVGGALLGVVLGWLTFRVMRHIDDYSLEVLLTLGLAFGGYELAVALHVSGPIMAVCAGLLIGDVGTKHGMSEETRRYVDAFWKLIDEILNAVLFLMIGFEVFAVAFTMDAVTAGVLSIILALIARLTAVAVPVILLRPFRSFSRGVVPIMTWGGLKGGISVALALSLPDNEWKPLILTATYIIVVFSIIVQGLTVAPLASRLGREPELM